VVTRRRGRRGLPLVGLGALLIGLAGCTPGPLAPPRGTGGAGGAMNKPILLNGDESSGTVEALRRSLEGTWELTALEYTPEGATARVPVHATGTLKYDEFGNLTIDARTTDAAAPVAAREVPRLSFEGRAVIDPVRHELRLMDLTGNVNPDEVLSLAYRRRFEFKASTLILSSLDQRGEVMAISTWTRRQ
jgi:hypothetical protein